MSEDPEKLRKLNQEKKRIPLKIPANRCMGDIGGSVMCEIFYEEFKDDAPENMQAAFENGYRVFLTHFDTFLAVAPEGDVISDEEGFVIIPEMINISKCYGDIEGNAVSEIDTSQWPENELTPQIKDAINKRHKIFETDNKKYLFVWLE